MDYLAKFGCPLEFITMSGQCHDEMHDRVHNDREFPEQFLVTHGAKTSLHLAPTPFSMMFYDMLWMLFRLVILVFQIGTALMASKSI